MANSVYVTIPKYTNTSTWSTMNSTIGAAGSSYTISTAAGANGTSGSYYYGNSNSWGNVTVSNSYSSGLHVQSDAKIDGDLTVQGISIVKTLEKINERLAILVPDPDKLEKYAALKKAYEHYKTLEALLQEPKKD